MPGLSLWSIIRAGPSPLSSPDPLRGEKLAKPRQRRRRCKIAKFDITPDLRQQDKTKCQYSAADKPHHHIKPVGMPMRPVSKAGTAVRAHKPDRHKRKRLSCKTERRRAGRTADEMMVASR